MGRVKDINSIPNLRILLAKEGFEHVKLSYLGGLWVLIELDNEGSKQKFLDHVGINSWLCTLLNAYNDFVSDERVVWVDIEGILLHVWSRETFAKIGNKWGEALDIEDNFGSSFARKRLCILTKQPESILEKFKVIFKGKVFVARAKELFTWNLSFLEPMESVYTSDDESKHGARILNDGAQNSDVESDDECNVDGVSETVFSDNVDECNVDGHGKETDKQQSEDPFGFYDLLNKLPAKGVHDASTSLSHPPGFTPKTSVTHANVGEICEDGPTNGEDMVDMPRVDAKVMDHSQEVHDSFNGESVSSFSYKVHNGGSILDILDDMVRVGHSMGYNFGCLGHKTKKEWVKELNYKHRINLLALQETKMDCVSHMDVKSLWGNSNFDFVASDSLGNSGGILCIWEASIFKKDGATISDNFIAIYGTWLPRNVKILLVAVYAPQQPGSKRALWDFYLIFARCFDRFIVSSGLVDVKLEGYSFTWSHPSASKMSKLDRFLVTEGIISLYPSISALCLDRHLSDHRPILLREVSSDFGPTPFRFYQSWFQKKKLQDLKSIIRLWVKDKKFHLHNAKNSLQNDLISIDKDLERGNVSDDILLNRMELNRRLQDIKLLEVKDLVSVVDSWCFVEGLFGTVARKSPGPDGFIRLNFLEVLESCRGGFFAMAVDYFYSLAANRIGCAVLNTPSLSCVTVGECMSPEVRLGCHGRTKLQARYLNEVTSTVFDSFDRKISWVAWDNVLASKLNGGLGVSSFFALNRALLLKWVWRFISGDGSLWCKVIQEIYGSKFDLHVTDQPSIWCSILREVKSLKDFWRYVANKNGKLLRSSASFRRDVADGALLSSGMKPFSILHSVVLSSSKDRWTCDLSGDGEFKVKVIRNFIDDLFLPSSDVKTRWVKFIPIKVNVFSWRARRDRLPTRVNLSRRGVLLDSICVLFVMLLWRMFTMFSFDVTWLGLFFVKFVVGGFGIGRRFVFLFGLGCLVLIPFGFLPSQVHIFRRCFLCCLVAEFGGSEISWSLTLRLLIVRRFLMTLFLGPFYGVLVDVVGFFRGSIG
ncbi:RNA-directed DNA polymerase, eukaryota [Tanacetum coccineum]|uniref:RNA-directed DNA polymerase, eukaryota n=1 Tax=Tanacetum coccineum TaxID=301880 RepID=A0ABQ5GZJ0_9ASTR